MSESEKQHKQLLDMMSAMMATMQAAQNNAPAPPTSHNVDVLQKVVLLFTPIGAIFAVYISLNNDVLLNKTHQKATDEKIALLRKEYDETDAKTVNNQKDISRTITVHNKHYTAVRNRFKLVENVLKTKQQRK